MKQVLARTIARLNRNKFFAFISSVRLAVPVMLAIGITVAAGTIFESLYNAEYAKAAVYNTKWFTALLSLLALNIFASMMSRFPWKKHQLGFVITHVGILTLLLGGTLTGVYGIDGSLQLEMNQANNRVLMPSLMVAYQYGDSPTLNSVVFERGIAEKSGSDLDGLNESIGHVIKIEKYLPFAEIGKGFLATNDLAGPVAVSFGLKSQFFSVKEWLHSIDNPVMQMGPATLKLIVDEGAPAPLPKKGAAVEKPDALKSPRRPAAAAAGGATIVVRDQKSGEELKTLSLDQLKKPVVINGVEMTLRQVFKRATVQNNKIVENSDVAGPANPAVELTLKSGGKEKREVLFAKFPSFSLAKGDLFGLAFVYATDVAVEAGADAALPAGHPQMGGEVTAEAEPSSQAMPGKGNVIEFHVRRSEPGVARIELWKDQKKVGEKRIVEGETFETPWMGIQVYLANVTLGAAAQVDARAVVPKSGMATLPSSAVFLRPQGSEEGFWLGLGEARRVNIRGRELNVIFGNNQVSLPFSVELKNFTKKDYPGTETPYSYESLVTYSGDNSEHLISMNEPFKAQGFTLYQASFIMNQGQPPISILSVNRDPGRPVKYLGSLILSLGIIIFTLMRSRIYISKKRVAA